MKNVITKMIVVLLGGVVGGLFVMYIHPEQPHEDLSSPRGRSVNEIRTNVRNELVREISKDFESSDKSLKELFLIYLDQK